MLQKIRNLAVGTKVFCIVGLCLFGLTGVAGLSIFQMDRIGSEITEIAEQDIPLTNALTKVTILQLEQTITLERAFRFGEEMEHSQHAAEQFVQSVRKFEELAADVDKELIAVEKMVQASIVHATSDAARKEFQHVLDGIKSIETEHTAFDIEAEKILELLSEGHIEAAVELEEAVEAAEEKLDHELEALLEEIGKFTLHSAASAEAHEQTAIIMLLIVSIIMLAVGAACSWYLVRSAIIGPLNALVVALDSLIAGNIDIDVEVYGEDEIGQVARSLEVFRQKLGENQELQKQAEAKKQADLERVERIDALNSTFDARVGGMLNEVAGAASQLDTTAATMASIAEQTNGQATAVANASEEAATNVQTVSAAAEELSASVGEITRQVAQSSEVSKRAVQEAERTNKTIRGLATAAQKIGQIINMINDTASQTNLLALNATIEAARAGESGKGFAVEEQGAATQEIARSVERAAQGTQEVSKNISGVTQGAGETGQAATQVSEAVKQLTTQSSGLQETVEKYLAEVKAA